MRSRKLSEKVVIKLQSSKHYDKLSLLGNSYYTDSTHHSLKSGFEKNLASIFSYKAKQSLVKRPTFEHVTENLQKGTAVVPNRETDIIELCCQASTPFEAAFITNTIANVFREENQLESQQEVRLVKNFLQEQLGLIKEKLNKSEMDLKNFKEM